MKPRTAFLIAVGDELLAGLHPDLNSPEIARRLGSLGMRVLGVDVVPDREEAIAAAVERARAEAYLVVVTGGLGPTLDDVTRHGIARALGRDLVSSPEAVEGLRHWFSRRGTDMPDANLRQALIPEGGTLVPNRVGTAPGFLVQEVDGVVASLPGPPSEMRVLLSEELEPWLVREGVAAAPLAERRFHLFGLSESIFAQEAGAWMDRDAAPLMGCSVKKGVLSVVIRASSEVDAALVVEERAAAFRERFGAHVFSEDEARIELVLGRALVERGTTVTVAESCTGGLVSALLTRVAGISAVFSRGFVVYSDAAKERELGVPGRLLERHGAVSGPVAEAMASGAAAAASAELALAVTGIAGPGGGSAEKPVGTVWFGTSFGTQVASQERRFPPGEREWIRTLAARHALFLGLRRLLERAN